MHAYFAVAMVVAGVLPAHAEDGPLVKRGREGHLISDGKGHYIAFITDPFSKDGDEEATHNAWYGDGKTFYAVAVTPVFREAGVEWVFADARVGIEKTHSSMKVTKDEMKLRCDDRNTLFTRVRADDAKAMLKKATFKPPRRSTLAFTAARDGTTYYVLDVPFDVTPKTANKSRLFIGKRGGLKALKVSRVEADNSGTRVTTATGVFWTSRVMFADESLSATNPGQYRVSWQPKRGEQVDLAVLDTILNGRLIYSELGIYPAQHGVPCDDL